MLVDNVIESQDAGLLESILIPLDLYNDSAQHALTYLKQRFLYDEIEAEVTNYDFQICPFLVCMMKLRLR
jgi:cytoplasmic FMR1 interacting protein